MTERKVQGHGAEMLLVETAPEIRGEKTRLGTKDDDRRRTIYVLPAIAHVLTPLTSGVYKSSLEEELQLASRFLSFQSLSLRSV